MFIWGALDGDLPDAWRDVLFDYEGQPTTDPEQGAPLKKPEVTYARPLRDLVYGIHDRPEDGVIETGKV